MNFRLTAKANDIKSKARELKSTATTQSESELDSTKHTDLNAGNNPQEQLKTKAGDLAAKATALSTKAGDLETAAKTTQSPQNPLQPLSGPATALKTAAKGASGLFKAAESLAARAKTAGQAATEANQVIQEFDEVEQKYEALMKQAKENGLTSYPEVIEVVKAYHSVKTTYYQMLIGYRFRYLIGDGGKDAKILKKAADLYTNAKALATSPKLTAKEQGLQADQDELKEQLRNLATTLRDAVGDTGKGLRGALSDLKAADQDDIVARALEVIKQYGLVKSAYGKVTARETEYNKLVGREYGPVKQAFEALETKYKTLKKSYENVLILRVQELSNKAQKLNEAASALSSGVTELRNEATQLANAAMGGGKGLKEKAEALVGAINTGTKVTTQATDVIEQFDTVTDKYEALIADPKYATHKTNPAIIAVDDAYNNLKSVYDRILNVKKANLLRAEVGNGSTDNKILHKAKELHEKANNLAIATGLQAQEQDTQKDLKAELRNLANTLAGAVGANESDPGLQKALNDLKSAQPSDIVEKANEVVNKYKDVNSAYGNVTAKEKEYKDALGEGETDKYTNVTSAFQALQSAHLENCMNIFKCLN